MWGSSSGIPPQPSAGIYGPSGGGGGSSSMAQQQSGGGPVKHDIFVGNLAFNTTEEQLRQAFSEIGKVLNVRMVVDPESGRSRGFSFVEFEDPQAALSAIRNMNEYELNGRRLRVNFSNSSHLEDLATKLGMDLTKRSDQQQPSRAAGGGPGASSSSGQKPGAPAAAAGGTSAVADALKGMSMAEMYDVVAKLKEISDRDPDEARRIISGHPQLPEALLFLMSQLDMVKTPIATAEAQAAPLMPPPATSIPPTRPADPRAAARVDPRQMAAAAAAAAVAPPPLPSAVPPVPAAAPVRVDPRQRADPRAAARADPRAAARQQQQQQQHVPPPPPPPPTLSQPPPPPPLAQYGMPPQQHHHLQQQQPPGGVSNLDPALVQQVMSLTPQQIQQLPPDKQQSILQLRQQITGGR